MATFQDVDRKEINRPEIKRVGPFFTSNMVNGRDSQLIEYVFDLSLDKREMVFSSTHSSLNRSEFITLQPLCCLDSKVIDIFVEHLTNIERMKKSMPLNWYLPLTFSTSLLHGDVGCFPQFIERQKIRENYMSKLVDCKKILIPVHINEHFYLYVVQLKNQEIQIWDFLSSSMNEEDHRETTQKLVRVVWLTDSNSFIGMHGDDELLLPFEKILYVQLLALDNLFVEDIRSTGLAFGNFSVAMSKNTPLQSHGYDCGIFVMNFMQQSVNEKINPSFQFHSEDERLALALTLLKSGINKKRETLYDKAAKRNYAQSGEEHALPKVIKRKGIDICRYSEDVHRGEHTTFDRCTRRIKKNVRSYGIQETSNSSNSLNDIRKGHTKGYALPTTDLIGEQFQNYTKQIWEWLMKDEVSVIGVWGMGGVGKTKLLKHIQNRLLERDGVDSFDYVIWVTVTQHCSISHLHEVIAKSIELDISDEHEEKRIVGKLFEKLRDINKCVIILDDVWDHIDLEDVGFLISNNRNKLILTTRSLDVCQSMNCKENIIRVKSLEREAAWELFRKTLGENVTLSPEVEKIAQLVVEECGGLPLAVATIAKSMRGNKDEWEWKHMLESLRNLENGQYHLDKWVFPALRSSYDHLESKKLQECFLYCVFVSRFNITESLVMEGLIDGMLSFEAQENECQSILNKLINNTLLEVGYGVHPLIRGMAVSIVKETHMVTIDKKLTEIPDDGRWTEKLEKVFLMENHIQNILAGTSPRCPKLLTLLLHQNYSLGPNIPNEFFINMTSLRVLNLSDTSITCLPESVSNLECLAALWLCGCESLRYVPSLAKLRKLMWLNLRGTAMVELPEGLEMLINLRWLDLRETSITFRTASTSLIAKLTNLQSLYLNCKPGLMDVKAQDLLGLEKLESISAHFSDIIEFNSYVISPLNRHQLRQLPCYYFSVGTQMEVFDDGFRGVDKIDQNVVKFVGVELGHTPPVLTKDMTEVIIKQCDQWRRCLCDVIILYGNNEPCKINSCEIVQCHRLEYLFCMSAYCSFCHCLQLVGGLVLKELKGLRVLCMDNGMVPPAPSLPSTTPFSHLTFLTIILCNGIKKLLTPELSTQLKNLKFLSVECCYSLKEIFSRRSGEEEDEEPIDGSNHFEYTVSLPSLQYMNLRGLPELHSLYKGTMDCHSLCILDITHCEKLKSLPKFQPTLEIHETPYGWSTS